MIITYNTNENDNSFEIFSEKEERSIDIYKTIDEHLSEMKYVLHGFRGEEIVVVSYDGNTYHFNVMRSVV